MSPLGWIVASGIAMSVLALSGGLTLLLPEPLFDRIVAPLVALAAGSLLGGSLFHLLPEGVEAMGPGLDAYVWLVAGFLTFFLLEQFLHWHHCHRPVEGHEPVGLLILIADGVHNFVGGLAVAGGFLADVRLGIVAWLAAAAHEIPQEMGDFGILVHSGWSRGKALAFNLLSALTFLVGGLLAYGLAGRVDLVWLLPFAAGNFLYIAAADLMPQLTSQPEARHKAELTLVFTAGLGLLLAVTVIG